MARIPPTLRVKDLLRPLCVPKQAWEFMVEEIGERVVSEHKTVRTWDGSIVVEQKIKGDVVNLIARTLNGFLGLANQVADEQDEDGEGPWSLPGDWWKQ